MLALDISWWPPIARGKHFLDNTALNDTIIYAVFGI